MYNIFSLITISLVNINIVIIFVQVISTKTYLQELKMKHKICHAENDEKVCQRNASGFDFSFSVTHQQILIGWGNISGTSSVHSNDTSCQTL